MVKLKKFSRKIENFNCENCNIFNIGNGYTNHCYNCLYSKHVDINPGDRNSLCLGLMKPIRMIFNKKKDFCILHKCLKCCFEKSNKISAQDNIEAFNKLQYF